MKLVIVKRDGYDKCLSLEKTRQFLWDLLSQSNIKPPKLTLRKLRKGCRGLTSWSGKTPTTTNISIDLKRCRPPAWKPGFAWSFTGYRCDMTPAGVLAHELGHHVFAVTQNLRKIQKHCGLWTAARKAERSITSYGDSNEHEDFAETYRLFALNPNLLWLSRPLRFIALTDAGLACHDLSWQEVLKHAHPRMLAAAEKFAAEGEETRKFLLEHQSKSR